MKQCSKCKEVKSVSEFWKDRTTSSGYRSYCKLCKPDRSNYHKQWAVLNKDKMREYSKRSKARPENKLRERNTTLKRNYGIDLEQYNQLIKDQHGLCRICKRPALMNNGKGFAVDHDHSCCPGKKSCGKCIRGLLCVTCNQALGMFLDSPEILNNAINYLKSGSLILDEKYDFIK